MIRKTLKVVLAALTGLVLAWVIGTTRVPRAPTVAPCTQQWFNYLEANYFSTADDEGHGPDLGDSEWFYSFERKAKLPDEGDRPDALHCQRLQEQLSHRVYIINPALNLSLSFPSQR